MKLKIYILVGLIIPLMAQVIGQNRWTNNYLSGEDPFAKDVVESYDKGYLLSGKYGPNYSSFNWLIKTDINGEILWNKTIGVENSVMSFQEIAINNNGEIYLAGSTYYYGVDDSDPLIMKLNVCGEKEWCRVFLEDGNNYSNALVVTLDGSAVFSLRYMNPNLIQDRICLAKLSSEGELMWKECYNSSDTSLYYGDVKDITICPDNGFLISGYCYYEDLSPQHYLWPKLYYIKTDSLGSYEWETVIHKDADSLGGIAWSTVLNNGSNYYYSSISHYYYNTNNDAPAIVKLDLQGNIIDINDIAPPDERGKLVGAKFINDTTLMACASWGQEPTSSPRAVTIDTLGNMINSTFLLDNIWMAHTEVTFDNKLLFLTNIVDENENFDAYLFKLNTELESDTLYTQTFIYDSLCPYQIVSDTIVQDGCGLIVGTEEIYAQDNNIENRFLIYPNPAKTNISISSKNDVFINEVNLYNQLGQKVLRKTEIYNNIDVSMLRQGLYIIEIVSDTNKIREKLIIK